MCQVGHHDPSSHQRVLMKTGLILLIVGHLNFITGALVHGIVLRFVVSLRDAISLQYAISNTASAICALLTISCGLAALMLSRYFAPAALVSSPSPAAPQGSIPQPLAWGPPQLGGCMWLRLTALPHLSPPTEMGSFGPERQQQPGLAVLPARAGRRHRAHAGQPGPGAAGALRPRRCCPRPARPAVPLRSHPRLQLHTVPLVHLPHAGLTGDRLQHPLPSAHHRAPPPQLLLPQGAPAEGLLADCPCGQPRPWAVPGLAEPGQCGNCPAVSRVWEPALSQHPPHSRVQLWGRHRTLDAAHCWLGHESIPAVLGCLGLQRGRLLCWIQALRGGPFPSALMTPTPLLTALTQTLFCRY
ncbi:transmembrane protein 54 isoform X1 [Anser cygnoides]|uniref:transmembrane protein 54 isoform X1 n=1 Tax=Anser cygnoides TaxID=8845 RepID=UPI0034D2A8F8